MRICPACNERYDDASRFCPRDGVALPVDAADERIGTTLLGQFELLEVCGKGAMGTVYRAWQAGMERQVAIKILRPELLADAKTVARFDREARAVAKLQHPNIVTFFLVGHTDDGVPFVAMEYVEGESLDTVAEREGTLDPQRVLHIVKQITGALSEAHAEGIVHRDLKPANILLTDRRRMPDFVKVLDFGIAKILGGAMDASEDLESRLTRTGAIFGTPHYIAPEQAAGGEIDHRADLYSLGVLLYRLLTGRLPFDGAGIDVLLAHMGQPVPPPRTIVPGFDRRLQGVILRALEKEPGRRYQSAEELGDALEAACGARSSSSRSAGRPAEEVPEETREETPAPAVDPNQSPSQTSVPPAEVSALPVRRGLPVVAVSSLVLVAGAATGAIWLLGRRETAVAAVPAGVDAAGLAEAPEPPRLPDPPPRETGAMMRTLTLGEEGYAIRVTLPRAVRVQVSYPVVFEVLDRSGKPLGEPHLVATLEDPEDAKSIATVPADDPGHYTLEWTFARPGLHHVHVFPDTARKLHIWFDVVVADENGKIPEDKGPDRHATPPKPRKPATTPPAKPPKPDEGAPEPPPPPLPEPEAHEGPAATDPYHAGVVDDDVPIAPSPTPDKAAPEPPAQRLRWRPLKRRTKPNPDGLE